MKKYALIIVLFLLVSASCSKDDDSNSDENQGVDYKNEMRNFVTGISEYSKALHPGFIVIPQNGQELATSEGTPASSPATGYLNAIDGLGREDLFYGYDNDDVSTPIDVRNYMISFLDRIKQSGKSILVTDYCFTPSKMEDSYAQNGSKGYVSFAADHRELDDFPSFPPVINNQNANNITSLSGVRNFLYLINPANFTKSQFISAIQSTNYDLVIMDLFIGDGQLSASEIESMKQKKDGGSRLVICYMSIGEAESYRYYWQSGWGPGNPPWLLMENSVWPGNYLVKYWDKSWQDIIYGNAQSYTKRILDAHFDGVYLDLVDAFENFE
ncbi:MAG: endo alpha-1,4 polygalactosaminidase [Bacteroidetes bacterium]|nr:endo alpha-1,4 polygalactosaminidase [Bacteroidota bacterium]